MSNQPTKLTLSCLDILLSQLTKEDLDKFNKIQEEKALAKVWIYKLDKYMKSYILFVADSRDHAIDIVSKTKIFRESLMPFSNNQVITTIYDITYKCIICKYTDEEDEHYHNIKELTDEHWITLVKDKLDYTGAELNQVFVDGNEYKKIE